MSKINDICKEIVDNVDDALACGVVDLQSGMLLGISHKISYFSDSYVEAVAAAAVDMFRGKTVSRVEKLIAQQRGATEAAHLIKEIQMTTERTFHFMALVPERPNALAVLITSTNTNLGMGWAGLRSSLPKMTDVVPA